MAEVAQLLTEARDLFAQGLAILDQISELDAAIHADAAIVALNRQLEKLGHPDLREAMLACSLGTLQ